MKYSLGVTYAVAALSSQVSGSPVPADTVSHMFERDIAGFYGCTPEQETRLNKAFGDAATLATNAFSMDQGSKAFTHYFRTEGDGKATDGERIKGFYSAIESNNDPTNPPYRFTVRCAKGGEKGCKKSGGSLAITDSEAEKDGQLREMVICPVFFDKNTKETVNDIDSKPFIKDPKRGQDSWCKTGNSIRWFEVAGHTLLHEMTHLSALAKSAGQDKPTDDVGGLGNDYLVAARKLGDLWHDGKAGGDTLEPSLNAESVAAAALEWFFMKQCGFTDMSL